MTEIGDYIRKRRGAMSIRGFAAYVGVSYTAVDDWEKGRKTPEPPSIRKLAAYLDGISEDELLAMAGHKTTGSPPPGEADLPSWLRELLPTLKGLDAYEAAQVENLTQSLDETRRLRREIGDPR